MSNKDTSTLQSAIDSVSSTAQGIVHTLTGNPGDKAAADRKEAEAEARSDLSHAAVKAGPFTATADGVAKDNPKRAQGSWNETIGSGQKFVGNLIGNPAITKAGEDRELSGKQEKTEGLGEDAAKALGDRGTGFLKGTVAQVTGDKQALAEAQEQHDRGKALQRGVEADLQKEARAE